jgi:hypothetical protein
VCCTQGVGKNIENVEIVKFIHPYSMKIGIRRNKNAMHDLQTRFHSEHCILDCAFMHKGPSFWLIEMILYWWSTEFNLYLFERLL